MASESIYNLIPQPVPLPMKEPLYRSKHDGKKAPTFSTFGLTGTSKPGYNNVNGAEADTDIGHHAYRKNYATFGKEGNAVPPTQILKKGTGGGGGASDYAAAAQTGMFKYEDRRMPTVPTVKELAVERAALKASTKTEPKNFITSNAVENILAVPKRDVEPVNWLKKPHFGEVPPYLQKIKQEISDEYEYIKSMQQQMDDAAPAGMRQLPEEERVAMVNALKTKWDQVNKLYQSTSCLSLRSLDTIGKVKRKEQYEAQLAQIEKDIEKLSKKVVYIADDY